jgi:hypothetical protein
MRSIRRQGAGPSGARELGSVEAPIDVAYVGLRSGRILEAPRAPNRARKTVEPRAPVPGEGLDCGWKRLGPLYGRCEGRCD